jgi:hypothetical protein
MAIYIGYKCINAIQMEYNDSILASNGSIMATNIIHVDIEICIEAVIDMGSAKR